MNELSIPQSQASELEVMPPSSVESLQRGEIDIQISTAHRFPRSMAVFKKRSIEMATLDEETAASCIYSRPIGKENGKMKYANGLSVRAAEIVAACYGNIRVGATIVEMTPRFVKARGFAHDLETNFASATEVVEATVKKDGTPYDERMRVVIAKAALAKARRDATFQVVPRALAKPIEAECQKIAIGDATTLTKRRDGAMKWIHSLGIDVERVFAALNVKGAEDIGTAELTLLTGLRTSIKDGDTKIDEAFPELDSSEKTAPPTPKFNKPARAKAKPVEKPATHETESPDTKQTTEQAKPDQDNAPEDTEAADQESPTPAAGSDADAIRLALRDMDIQETWFVDGLKMIVPDKIQHTAKVVADLSDEVVGMIKEDGVDELLAIIRIKEAKAGK